MSNHISFASLNLYNFQAVGEKVYSKVVTQKAYQQKLKWTQDKIFEVDADVIAFQELWTRACLVDVFSDPRLTDYELIFIKDGINASWKNIAVAMAVRTPWKVTGKKRFKQFPFTNITQLDDPDVGEDHEVDVSIKRFSRTILKVTIDNPDDAQSQPIDVYVAHFKAKLPSNRQARHITAKHRKAIATAISTIRRTAEAAALRWILTNAMKGNNQPTVVIGDLNDDPRSNTLTILTEQPNLSANAGGRDTALYSCLQLEQLKSHRDVIYTHQYNNLKDTLDHILVSREFFEYSASARFKHVGTRVWNDFIEDEHVYSSDHGIIRAEFEVEG